MKRILPWLAIALLAGTTAGSWCAGGSARAAARDRANQLVALEAAAERLYDQRDSLEREVAYLETEQLQAKAKARADSAARAAITVRIGPVVSRDPDSGTAVLIIDGLPREAPLVLLEERAALFTENASLRTRAGVAEAGWDAEKKAHASTKRILENTQMQLELARVRPGFLERMKQDAVKIGGGALVGLIVAILL